MKKASGVSAGLLSSYNDAKWLIEGQRKVKGRSRKIKEGQRKMLKKYYYVKYKESFSEGSEKL